MTARIEAWWQRLSPRGRTAVCVVMIVACNLPGLHWISHPPPLHYPDTPLIMQGIRQDTSLRGVASWLTKGWPLGNGFYRPLPLLSLVLDNAIYYNNGCGYRLTNWLLATVCAVCVGWLMLLLSSRWSFATAAAMLFSLRQSGVVPQISSRWATLTCAACLVVLIYQYAHANRGRTSSPRTVLGSSWAVSVLAVLAVVGLEWPSTAIVVYWIAARTALMGALFSVCCLGSFIGLCRTERAALAVPVALFGAAALASYEQALVLPLAALLIVAGLRVHRKRLAASGLGILFALVLLYIIVRVAVMGLEASAYQLMQTKSSLIGPVRGLCDYVLSPWYLALMAWDRATLGGLYAAGDHLFWWAVAMPVAWVASYARGLRANPRLFGALWATKAVIFLPMAQLHLTEHYYYLPEVAACALAVALVWPRGIQQVTAQSPAKGL